MTSPAPTPAHRRAEAEAETKIARDRLSATLADLQERLDPRILARTAARDAQEAGERAARVGADTVRRNPGATAGLAALAGLFLARHRIAALFRRKPKARKPAKPPVLPFVNEGASASLATYGDRIERTRA